MIQAIRNLFKRKPLVVPAPPAWTEWQPDVNMTQYLAGLDAVRTEMSKPAKASHPLRKYDFYDIEVGETRRLPLRAHGALRNWSFRSGKKFTCKTASNGLWVKRVA
jgi:hypothetical protein